MAEKDSVSSDWKKNALMVLRKMAVVSLPVVAGGVGFSYFGVSGAIMASGLATSLSAVMVKMESDNPVVKHAAGHAIGIGGLTTLLGFVFSMTSMYLPDSKRSLYEDAAREILKDKKLKEFVVVGEERDWLYSCGDKPSVKVERFPVDVPKTVRSDVDLLLVAGQYRLFMDGQRVNVGRIGMAPR